MAPRKRRTTSADRSRNKGKGAKKVTGKTPQSRANRQRTSTARVTRSGQGGGRGRVTNASQRTSTGSARVTGKPQLALPPGKKGGSLVKPKSQTSRQAAARVKAARAAKGTKGGTRVGQPAGSANRMYGANVVNKAVNRATKAVKGARRLSVGRGGLAVLALKAANKIQDRMLSPEQLALKRANSITRENSNKPFVTKKALRNVNAVDPMPKGKAKKAKPTAGTSGVTSRKSGSSTKARPAAVAAPKKAAAPKKTAPKKSAIHTYKKHGSALHVGRYKTLKEHRAAVAKAKKDKKK